VAAAEEERPSVLVPPGGLWPSLGEEPAMKRMQQVWQEASHAGLELSWIQVPVSSAAAQGQQWRPVSGNAAYHSLVPAKSSLWVCPPAVHSTSSYNSDI
jgi:hypothetical protein